MAKKIDGKGKLRCDKIAPNRRRLAFPFIVYYDSQLIKIGNLIENLYFIIYIIYLQRILAFFFVYFSCLMVAGVPCEEIVHSVCAPLSTLDSHLLLSDFLQTDSLLVN